MMDQYATKEEQTAASDRTPMIPERCDQLHAQMSDLHLAIVDLEERLEKILRPEDRADGVEKLGEVRELTSPHAEFLEIQARSARDAAVRIRRILDRLEL